MTTGITMDCPTCGSVMASYQTMDGAFFICGGCGLEIPVGGAAEQTQETGDAERGH